MVLVKEELLNVGYISIFLVCTQQFVRCDDVFCEGCACAAKKTCIRWPRCVPGACVCSLYCILGCARMSRG